MTDRVEDRLAVIHLHALQTMRAVTEGEVGTVVKRDPGKLLLVFLRFRAIAAHGAGRFPGAELHGRRSIPVVLRDDENVNLRTKLANVIADARDVARFDRRAVERGDLGDTRLRGRRNHVLVLIPASGVLKKPDLDAFAFDDHRTVRFVEVAPGADVLDAVRIEDGEALEDVVAARRDVIGHSDDGDVGGFQRFRAVRAGMRPFGLVGDVDRGAG
jgi:hypothetical protein